MKRQARLATPVPINPDLESRWQAILPSRPDGEDAEALAAWNEEHGPLIAAYEQAVAQGQAGQREQARAAAVQFKRRRRLRLRWAAGLAGLVLVSGAGAYWLSLPSEDEARLAEFLRREQACAAQYQQTHGLTLVTQQVDLLKDGEGGWVDLSPPPGEPPVIGDVDVFPADLVTGKTGEATVEREGLVYKSGSTSGRGALIGRQNGHLVLLLFYGQSGFYSPFPHAPLQTPGILSVEVRGAAFPPGCW